LEREFRAAARGRLEPECRNAQKTLDEDIGTLKKLLAETVLENEKLKRRLAG